MDWQRKDVRKVLDGYAEQSGRLTTLAQLQDALFKTTGNRMGISTIHRHLVKKRAAEQTDDGSDSKESEKSKKTSYPFRRLRNGALQFSMKPDISVLAIPVGDGLVRKFVRVQTSVDGRTSWFRCNRCHYLKRKMKSQGKEVCIKVSNGKVLAWDFPHTDGCHPIPEESIGAQKSDRKHGLGVRRSSGRKSSHAWKEKHDLLLEGSPCEKEMRSSESPPLLSPVWDDARTQYSGRSSDVELVNIDPPAIDRYTSSSPERNGVSKRDQHTQTESFTLLDGFCAFLMFRYQMEKLGGNPEHWVYDE